MNLSELRTFLHCLGLRPKKGLSQHFLIDGNISRKILRLADVQRGEPILEIGPGPGALTALLLKEGARVFAIEKDPVLAKALSRLQTRESLLTVFCEDILEFSFAKLPSPLKVIANLPYRITTPILEKLFQEPQQFSSLTVMVQREVGKRLLARPRTADFGSLSLFVQFHVILRGAFSVAPSCFYPRPKVHSTVLRLDMRNPPLLENSAPFFSCVRRAFQKRRKMLCTSLSDRERIGRALSTIGASPQARPEELSLEQWLAFFKEIDSEASL